MRFYAMHQDFDDFGFTQQTQLGRRIAELMSFENKSWANTPTRLYNSNESRLLKYNII